MTEKQSDIINLRAIAIILVVFGHSIISSILVLASLLFPNKIIKLITSIVLVLCLFYIIPSSYNKYVDFISKNSFGIYLFHSPLIYITFTYFSECNPILVVTLNFLFFGGIALLLTLLLKKTNLKFIIGE